MRRLSFFRHPSAEAPPAPEPTPPPGKQQRNAPKRTHQEKQAIKPQERKFRGLAVAPSTHQQTLNNVRRSESKWSTLVGFTPKAPPVPLRAIALETPKNKGKLMPFRNTFLLCLSMLAFIFAPIALYFFPLFFVEKRTTFRRRKTSGGSFPRRIKRG
jgi:hypothetical protein